MEKKVFAARNKNQHILIESSSGGMFTAFADLFLAGKNAVVCAVYDYERQIPVFQLITSEKERERAQGTKYVQADMGNIYEESVSWLKSNPEKKIVFFGLGCQTAAFKRFMDVSHMENRVVLIDLICHGVPSPLVWKKYCESVAGDKKFTYVNFRDKRNGWNHSTGMAWIENEEISIHNYRKLYSTRCLTRESCFFCPYANMNRISDITIGDFWGIEKSLPDFQTEQGASLVILHTEQGDHAFSEIMEKIEYAESSVQECLQENLIQPTRYPKNRESFWNDFKNKDMDEVIKRYTSSGIINKLRRKLLK